MLPPPIKDLKNEKGEQIYVTDVMIDRLLADDVLKATQKKAYDERKSFSTENYHQLRVRCKRDLFFLCYAILGNTRLSRNLHGHLCAHVKRTENERFHEYLLARGNFKSTILTIAKTIQVVLPVTAKDLQYDGWWLRPGEAQTALPWPASLGTDCRCLIAHETHEGAARFLYAISNHFLSNVLLQALFQEAIPSPRKHRINKWELELPRNITGNPEPTVDTLGVGGKSQGRHYNHIALDDIFGDKARDSAAESDTVKDWLDNIQSFFSTFKKDTLDLIGTRYSHDDIYAHAEDRYEKQLVIYKRKIEETDPANPSGPKIITFPEEFTPESLAILRKNKRVFNAQYLNDPDEGDAGFKKEYKRFFYWRGLNEIIAFDGVKQTTISIRDLDVCILIDPGLGSSGGFAVTGMDYLQRIFSLVALRIELRSPELTELVFKQVVRWQPRVVAIESDMFASTFEHWWISEMAKRQIRFKIEPVYTKKKSKDDRIKGLEQYFSSGLIFHNEAQEDLDREINTWGKSKNIHILDALAYGPEVWRRGYPPGSGGKIDHQYASDDIEGRDIETGYSEIN